MIRSQGILTSAGGTNSHAAVVARGEGIPAVCGADAIRIDVRGRAFTANGTKVSEGDVITIDGFAGAVYEGELDLEESKLEKARSGDREAMQEKIWKAFDRIMSHADATRRLRVRANADTPDQSKNARDRGAEGIGLCRTEHMFLGEERVAAVRKMIFADTEQEEQEAYDALQPLQREDFVGIFRAMDGLPVTVRVPPQPRGRGHGRRRGGGPGRGSRSIARRDAVARRGQGRAFEARGAARGQPHARPAWGPAGDREAGPVRHAGPGHRRGGLPREAGGPRSARGDHDPARGHEGGAPADARGAGAGGERGSGVRRGAARASGVGDHDRASQGLRDRR